VRPPNEYVRPEGFPGVPEGWVSEGQTIPAVTGDLFEMLHHREPWERPKALVIMHGFGEHGGRYLHFPHYLRDAVDAVFVPDLRGHGRSSGKRGDAESFETLVSDWASAVRRFHLKLQGRFPEPEIHVLAHSLGGLVALHLFKTHQDLPVKSLIFSAPLLGLRLRVSRLKQLAARILGKLFKSYRLPSGLDSHLFSHDPAAHRAIESDGLCHGKMSVRLITAMMKAMREMAAWRGPLVYPALFMVPLDDHIVDPSATLAFVEALAAKEKKLVTYETSYHEPFNEGGGAFSKDTAFADLEAWLQQPR